MVYWGELLARLIKEYPGIDPMYAKSKMPLHMFLRLLQVADKQADTERTRNDAEWMQQERERRAGLG